MADFIVAELAETCGQGRIVVFDLGDLLSIMFGDNRLDRFGAGVRGFFAQQCGADTQAQGRQPPDRRHDRRPDIFGAQNVFKGVEMDLLFALHARELLAQTGFGRIRKDHTLAFVDMDGRQFTGVIDAQHFLDAGAHGALSGAGRGRGGIAGHSHSLLFHEPFVQVDCLLGLWRKRKEANRLSSASKPEVMAL